MSTPPGTTPGVNDGCEWDPDGDRPAQGGDEHNRTVPSTLMIGANTAWRLCTTCAALPRFGRYRVRRPVRSKS